MELLAPAGTYDCLVAAVNSGADAVYFAGKGFGARSFAGNLSDEEIYRAADFCHLRNVRSYVTVNTLVFDREYKELENFIKTITRAGVDGVIVQDLGVLRYIREMSPDIDLHGSTQMTVHSADGVTALERLGVSRVVLSRELSADEMREIIANTNAEAEVFVHGAMCMSYSGQCLMSSVIGGRSGNRGKCAQPCRLPYSADGKNPKFYLSLKDMSLAEHIAELRKIGVSSLKIEGRMKGETYVSAVVSAYRRLIDENRIPTKDETEGLNRVFFRGGLTDGYFSGQCGINMFAFDKPDNPYLKNNNEIIEITEKQMPVNITAEIAEGEPPKVCVDYGEYYAEVTGDEKIRTAAKRPATEEGILKQLTKTGGTAFYAERAGVQIKGNPFVPVSMLNELRRSVINKLENEILAEYRNKKIFDAPQIKTEIKQEDIGYTCSVLNIEQYKAVKEYNFKRIYIPLYIVSEFLDELLDDKERAVITLPVILRAEQREKSRAEMKRLKNLGFDKAEVSTIDAIELADGFKIYGSQRLNITNSYSAEEYNGLGFLGICLSVELNLAQLRDISKPLPTETVVYGHIPVMITENCILKNMGKCPCEGIGEIVDRTGTKFSVVRDGDICRSVVLNSYPLYMGDKKKDIIGTGADLRLVFTVEDEALTKKICDDYISDMKYTLKKYTRLNYYKSALE